MDSSKSLEQDSLADSTKECSALADIPLDDAPTVELKMENFVQRNFFVEDQRNDSNLRPIIDALELAALDQRVRQAHGRVHREADGRQEGAVGGRRASA
jgi:hypothetical protein